MNEPTDQNPPRAVETTDSQDRMVTFILRQPILAKAVLEDGPKSLVHAYTIHPHPKKLSSPIHTEVPVIKSISD